MKVYISNTPIFENKDIEPCVSFALQLHQASNVVHDITVQDTVPDDETHTTKNVVRLLLQKIE